MRECLLKSGEMKKLNSQDIFDKEYITINKSNSSINVSIESVLNIFDERIGNLPTVFKNYNQLNSNKIKFRNLFDDFGEYILKIFLRIKMGE